MNVGLDAIAFHTSQHFVDMGELAEARGIEPAKFIYGLGQIKMSIACPPEDTVYLAINAAFKALKNFDLSPDDIGTLVVGTETGVDHSKPVAVYVHKALGLPTNCITYETKHACFGAMAAMSSACDWIASGRANGKKALIIAADIANYQLYSPAEPTQGAGAVAMVVSSDPKLVKFNREVNGHYTKNVMDFWRPLYSKEAFTDGHYSISCYLDALQESIMDAGAQSPDFDDFTACLYHVPFVKMAAKAHKRHVEYKLGQAIEKDDPNYDLYLSSYRKKTEPWLGLNAQVGNIYTGSLFLSLINLLSQGVVKPDLPISLFSYGSGCAASFSVISLVEGYEFWSKVINPIEELDARQKLSIADYETIMKQREDVVYENGVLNPSDWGLNSDFLYLGNKHHVRQYGGLEVSPVSG